MLQNLSWSSVRLCSVLTGCCYWCYRICPDLVSVFSVDGLLLLMLQNLSWSSVCVQCWRAAVTDVTESVLSVCVQCWGLLLLMLQNLSWSSVRLCSVLTGCCYWCYRICPDLVLSVFSVDGLLLLMLQNLSWSSVRLCSVLRLLLLMLQNLSWSSVVCVQCWRAAVTDVTESVLI